ncbi:MAG TPA: XrtA/PEP-CTERM system histidine kinase PrsK [Candidatus Acidoferrales bacterium]|nr:XrtA/PEP-CTERM system histidine kinase PrsK [Candidatus Acidoferrales bacterium]
MLAFVGAIFCGVVAFAVVWNERRSAVQLAFVAGMLLLALESVLGGLSWRATATSWNEVMQWQQRRLWTEGLLPGVWLFFAVGYGRGNYREFLNRWRFLLLAAFVLPLGLLLADGNQLIAAESQSDGSWQVKLGSLAGFLYILLLLGGVFLAGINLEKTFRASVGIMRWRIKFMILGLGVLLAVRFCTLSQVLLSHTLDFRLQMVDAGALFVACLLILRALFRAGHFELDVYPSHAVLQNSLTVGLAGVYLLAIGLFAKIVSWFHLGQAELIQWFVFLVAAVLLAILLLSDRLRLRLSRFVSRHFQRPLYDYRTVWRRFTEATASCVNQTDLCQVAVKAVADVFQALSVSVWLVDEQQRQLVFAASTFLAQSKADTLCPNKDEFAEVLQALRAHHEPVDIDAAQENWADHLRHCHPDEFRKGGNRVCVPMIVGDEVIGIMILGDRVSAAKFTWQDFDLLKCIGDHIGAGLMNTRLSQKLLQAKELEAFQTMSAFFVHDLKNTANTLNLMLQNLPVHFDDPAFRADALRGVSKTVAHINHLIGRLGSIRHELQIKPVEADLNELVGKSLAGWEEVAGIHLKKELAPLPKVWFDPELMLKVATNLIFNAREAVPPSSGEVRIQTLRRNGWAVLAISDNGCGMSTEFLSRSLFRPFQTTKKNGLGIGMFQSKMIVEAHKGKIEVESETGKGTTFRILLPLQKT